MTIKKNILVFPCGSEIGLEVHRSLRYSTHFDLVGANSANDHGKFVYEKYIGTLPHVDDPDFIQALRKVVAQYAIDAIYPTMDKVIFRIKQHEQELNAMVISSPLETTSICYSKKLTYGKLKGLVETPRVYGTVADIPSYPVFVKPDKGYGARGAKLIAAALQLESYLKENTDAVIMEYLPGAEYTIDCFTSQKGKLLFAGPRERKRITNGISVNTTTIEKADPVFYKNAEIINQALELRGAWFFQMKMNKEGVPVLLEVASRLAGTSSVHRVQGVNFAMLSLFDAFGYDVSIFRNNHKVEVDRALNNKYKLDIDFDTAYIDLDDTLIIGDKVNVTLVGLLYQFLNEGKKIILITKHELKAVDTLQRYRMTGLFDTIISLKKNENKADFIEYKRSIFIDDSFAERKNVFEKLGIPVFAPDAVECLLS